MKGRAGNPNGQGSRGDLKRRANTATREILRASHLQYMESSHPDQTEAALTSVLHCSTLKYKTTKKQEQSESIHFKLVKAYINRNAKTRLRTTASKWIF